MEKLADILKKHYVDNAVFHTHVSLIKPRGKFQFGRDTLMEFWTLYCDAVEGLMGTTSSVSVEESEEGNFIMGVAEKPQAYLPVLVDVDLKVEYDENIIIKEERLYTWQQLITVIEIYQSILRNIVQDCTDDMLKCVVLEKKMRSITKNEIKYFKHGFHLHFPFCFLHNKDQEAQLIPRAQEMMTKRKVFENLGIEDSGSVIDKAVCTVPWLLYGSRKSEETPPYLFTRVVDASLETTPLEYAFRHYQIFDQNEEPIKIKGRVKYFLPRILSIIPFGRTTYELKKGLISPLKEKIKKEKIEKEKKEYNDLSHKENLELAKKLMALLSDTRAQSRNEWMEVGWALYSIFDGHSDGFDLWNEFSARDSSKYNEDECLNLWSKMVKRNVTIGTLRHYAKTDNPAGYTEFSRASSEYYIEQSMIASNAHNDVAKALKAEWGDEFRCASITNKIWFRFHNHKWEDCEEGIDLRAKISNELAERFTDMIRKLFDQRVEVMRTGDKAREATILSQIKNTEKMIGCLKSSPYKTNVMKECMEVFYDRRFKEELDKNPFLIAFTNGVYDLKNNIFRAGSPEDFLSKSLPIPYIEYNKNDKEVEDVHDFFIKVFPDESVRKYFLDISSDLFVGGNFEKTFVFWTGEGNNGKTVTQSFFEMMLGRLAIKFPTSIVTGKKPMSGTASPELARAGGGVRWAVMDEPNPDEEPKAGDLKKLSGGDSIYARDLFEKGKDGREICPLFKICMICNRLPKVKNADQAFWNRIRVIPFETTFCLDPNDERIPKSYEEQIRQKIFPADKEFVSKKLPNLLSALAWVLLEHRKTLKVRIEPAKVRAATDMYKKQNDIYKQFMDEMLVQAKDKYISLSDLYTQFKEWWRDGMPGSAVPVKSDVEEYFTKAWGDAENGKKWKGWGVRVIERIPIAEEFLAPDGKDESISPML